MAGERNKSEQRAINVAVERSKRIRNRMLARRMTARSANRVREIAARVDEMNRALALIADLDGALDGDAADRPRAAS